MICMGEQKDHFSDGIVFAFSDNPSTTISVIMSAQCGPRLRYIEGAQRAQFYAPLKASIKEFRLCPVFILHLFVTILPFYWLYIYSPRTVYHS